MTSSVTTDAQPAGLWSSLLAYAGLDALRKASFVVLLPIYLAYLPPAVLGELVLYNVVAALLAVVANLRIDAAMRTLYFDHAGDRAGQDRYLALLFSMSLLLILACGAVLLIVGPALYSAVFADTELRFYPHGVLAVSASFAHTALAPLFVYLRNRRALRRYSGYSLFLIVTGFVLQTVLISQAGLGILGALLGALLPPVLLLVFLLVSQPRQLLRWPERSAVMPSLRFSVPLVGFSLLYLLESRLDRFFLERYADLETVGVYGLLAALLGLCAMLLNALDTSIRPWLYEALGESRARAQQSVRTFAALYTAVGVLSLSLIALAGSGLEWFTTDSRYLAVRDWLALGVTAILPMVFTRFWALLYLYHKQTTRLTMWTLARTIVTIVLLMSLTPRFGVPGVLIALFVSQSANALIFHVELTRHGFAAVRDIRPLAQALGFVAVIWGTRLVLPAAGYPIWGLLQLALTAYMLAALHRHTPAALRQLLSVTTDTPMRQSGSQ